MCLHHVRTDHAPGGLKGQEREQMRINLFIEEASVPKHGLASGTCIPPDAMKFTTGCYVVAMFFSVFPNDQCDFKGDQITR